MSEKLKLIIKKQFYERTVAKPSRSFNLKVNPRTEWLASLHAIKNNKLLKQV